VLDVAVNSVHCYVLGEHGEAQFVAWQPGMLGGGMPLKLITALTPEKRAEIEERTRLKAYDILERKGATYYGVAACVAELCERIVFDRKMVTPVSCYDPNDQVYSSMPAVIGARGIERVLELPLSEDETVKRLRSVRALKFLVEEKMEDLLTETTEKVARAETTEAQ